MTLGLLLDAVQMHWRGAGAALVGAIAPAWSPPMPAC